RRVLELPHGAAEGIGDLTRCWRMAEGVGEGCRWRDWSLGDSREIGQRALIVMDENRSMLKNGPVAPPLGAPRELFSIDHELAGGGRVETGRRTRRRRAFRWSGDFGPDAEAVQARDEHTVDPIVRLAKVAGVQGGGSHAVGDLAMVEDGAPTGRSPDDAESPRADSVHIIDPSRRLIAAQGTRGRGPRVHAKGELAGLACARHQRLVEGHVLRAAGRRGEEQAPDRLRHGVGERVEAVAWTLT